MSILVCFVNFLIYHRFICKQIMHHEHFSLLIKKLLVFGSMYSKFLRSFLKFDKVSAKPFTVNFLAVSAMCSSSSSNYSLFNSSGITSRRSSMSIPKVKVVYHLTTVLLILETSSSLANHLKSCAVK